MFHIDNLSLSSTGFTGSGITFEDCTLNSLIVLQVGFQNHEDIEVIDLLL
uniref:Uncharacterized protein n=1 Tax=Arion vulgaris TaxID=1028688 RepID=A0A0B7ANV4_9EUPU